MKYIYFFLFLIPFLANSQKHMVLKTNSLNYLFKTGFNVAAEVETKQNRTLNFAFEMGDRKINYENLAGEKDKFIVFYAEKRKYLYGSKLGITPSGLFIGPFLKYRFKDKVQLENNPPFNNAGVFKAHFLGLGYVLGYQNFIAKRISVEAKLGLGIQARLFIQGTTNLTPVLPDGLIGLAFGFRF